MKTKLISTSLIVSLGFLLICLGNASAMEVASDIEIASVKGMACFPIVCCYKVKNGDMCTGPYRYGAICSSDTEGYYCTDLVSGPSKHDTLMTGPWTANLATTWCKKYEDGYCAYFSAYGWYCNEDLGTFTNGTRKYGTGKKCPWYW
jgi:hypothetical protein